MIPLLPCARPPALPWEIASPKLLFRESSRVVGPQKDLVQSGTFSSLACTSVGGTGRWWKEQTSKIFSSSAALPFAARSMLVLCWQRGTAVLIHRQLNRWQSLRRKQKGILNLWIIWGIRRDDPEAYEILQCIFSSWNNRGDFSSRPTLTYFCDRLSVVFLYSCSFLLQGFPQNEGLLARECATAEQQASRGNFGRAAMDPCAAEWNSQMLSVTSRCFQSPSSELMQPRCQIPRSKDHLFYLFYNFFYNLFYNLFYFLKLFIFTLLFLFYFLLHIYLIYFLP